MIVRDEDGDVFAEPVTMTEYLGVCDREPSQRVRGSAFESDYQRYGRWVGERAKILRLSLLDADQITIQTEMIWTRFDSRSEAEAFLDRIAEQYDTIDLRS